MESCHIVPIGPAGIGKTTLVCSVIDAMVGFLEKSGLKTLSASVKGQDKKRLESRMAALRAASGNLPETLIEPTAAPETCTVEIGAKSSSMFSRMLGGSLSMSMVFHDYPGSLAEDLPRFTREVARLPQAEVLLVPVDATLLMEAASPQEEVAAQALHRMTVIEELIVEWEKGRADAGRGLLIFAPVRCERFFSDNGMQAAPGEAERLSELVINRHFLSIIDIVRFFGNNIHCFYIPVDTLGNVALTEKAWSSFDNYSFRAGYAMTGAPRPFGAEMIALIILDYYIKMCRLEESGRALEEMEKNLDACVDRYRMESGYNRALSL
ncbi:MAG: hypothetical protein Q4F72_05980 [Desulfovibrionaceae bacterium]|nr:hypothetical protein [Desulfovibrionaceae bacterium]